MTGPAAATTWTSMARAIALENELRNNADAGTFTRGTFTRAICSLVDDAIDNAVKQLRDEFSEQLTGKVDVDDAIETDLELGQLRAWVSAAMQAPPPVIVDTRGLT